MDEQQLAPFREAALRMAYLRIREEARWELPSSTDFLVSAMRSMDMAEDDIKAMVVSMCDSNDLAGATAGSTPCALATNTPSSQHVVGENRYASVEAWAAKEGVKTAAQKKAERKEKAQAPSKASGTRKSKRSVAKSSIPVAQRGSAMMADEYGESL